MKLYCYKTKNRLKAILRGQIKRTKMKYRKNRQSKSKFVINKL